MPKSTMTPVCLASAEAREILWVNDAWRKSTVKDSKEIRYQVDG